MSFLSNPDLSRFLTEAQNLLDVATNRDINYRKELQQMHATLRTHYAGSYGDVLNSVDKDKAAPSEREFQNKILRKLEELEGRFRDVEDTQRVEPRNDVAALRAEIAELKSLADANNESPSKLVATGSQRKERNAVNNFFDGFFEK